MLVRFPLDLEDTHFITVKLAKILLDLVELRRVRLHNVAINGSIWLIYELGNYILLLLEHDS